MSGHRLASVRDAARLLVPVLGTATLRMTLHRSVTVGIFNPLLNNRNCRHVFFFFLIFSVRTQMTVFNAIVDDTNSAYQVQIGRRDNGAMTVIDPSTISGEYFPALQVSIAAISPLPKPPPVLTRETHFGQLEARGAQLVKANAWQSIIWNFATPLLDGVTVTGQKMRFIKAGVYQASIAYRPGGGGDVWTSARVFDGTKSVGHAVGHGHPANDPAVITLVWLFNVADINKNYEIQIGRLTSSLNVHSTPSSIEGETLPNFQSTLELVQDNYIQLEGKAYSSGKNCQPVQFQSAPLAKGISLPKAGADIKFSKPGVYQVWTQKLGQVLDNFILLENPISSVMCDACRPILPLLICDR